MSVFRIYVSRRQEEEEGEVLPVALAFQAVLDLYRDMTGEDPDGCRMSIDLAKRAACEELRGTPATYLPRDSIGMFKVWHPTILFAVDLTAPPKTLLVFGSVSDEPQSDHLDEILGMIGGESEDDDDEPAEPWASEQWRPS